MTETFGTDTVPEPVTVDRNDPPAVMVALGFDLDEVQAVVITRTGLLGISANYPPTPYDPEAPEPETPTDDDPTQED